MRHASSAAAAPIANAVSRLILGTSTSHGDAIAVNRTASKCSPRDSTVIVLSGPSARIRCHLPDVYKRQGLSIALGTRGCVFQRFGGGAGRDRIDAAGGAGSVERGLRVRAVMGAGWLERPGSI